MTAAGNRSSLRPVSAVALAALTALGACAARPAPLATPAAPAATAGSPTAGSPAPAVPAARPPRRPGPPPLVGHLTRAALEEYESWKALRAEDYTPGPVDLKAIAAGFAGVETLVVVGTWCPDSKRDVPRFFKVMDLAHQGLARVTLIGVDRTKRDSEGLTDRHSITRVPTFVFFRGGREIGRVTEKPSTTLEHDIALILSR